MGVGGAEGVGGRAGVVDVRTRYDANVSARRVAAGAQDGRRRALALAVNGLAVAEMGRVGRRGKAGAGEGSKRSLVTR